MKVNVRDEDVGIGCPRVTGELIPLDPLTVAGPAFAGAGPCPGGAL